MAYHHAPRQAKGGLGTAVLFLVLLLAGGGYVAATMESGPSAARVYLAQDLTAQAAAVQ
ncbi:hypothetical protein ABID21_000510 [Pseudorhizobium tarimense]|uniref:Uncharacterized protein n=1 Tax=Pseudorhizobium tarimense TaxID=1079109 RepID=A0ABV2H1J1_9HYPH|nr:hypothetical protein [Pseudorhizobium tarimense]MCJ8517959.1 hypothetical protein [Pseudorhizobium tarimense]